VVVMATEITAIMVSIISAYARMEPFFVFMVEFKQFHHQFCKARDVFVFIG